MTKLEKDATGVMRAVFRRNRGPKAKTKIKSNLIRLLDKKKGEAPERTKNLSFVRQHYNSNPDFKRVSKVWKKNLYAKSPIDRPEFASAAPNSKANSLKRVEVASYKNSRTRRLVKKYRRRKPSKAARLKV